LDTAAELFVLRRNIFVALWRCAVRKYLQQAAAFTGN
jgi:hypothetical protein